MSDKKEHYMKYIILPLIIFTLIGCTETTKDSVPCTVILDNDAQLVLFLDSTSSLNSIDKIVKSNNYTVQSISSDHTTYYVVFNKPPKK